MINPLTIVTGIAMAAIIGHTFDVKRGVGAMDRELRDIRRATEEVERGTQALAAEWARLNDQERLRGLAERHLGQLAPMQTTQFVRMDEGVRRLPAALAWAGEPSAFAPRREGAAVAVAQAPAPARPPEAAPVVRPAPPAALAAATAPEPVRPARPVQLAEAAPAPAAPRITAPRVAPVPAEAAPRVPPAANALPPVAAPPARVAPPMVAAAPLAEAPARLPSVAAPPARPPALAAVAAQPRPADSAALPPVRSAMHVQRAESGSLLGNQAVAMAPPVPWGR